MNLINIKRIAKLIKMYCAEKIKIMCLFKLTATKTYA